ncbi:MAG: hypothetical protein SCALA702_22340 [Melioribacteraceae bacterium]|nr:MAG: hypothetical protein SCALA702_22340 [Melioribacteraceae bacterium]
MRNLYLYILLISLITVDFSAQSAKVSLPVVGSAGGEVSVPVVAQNLTGVGAITLKIEAQEGLEYLGYENLSEKLSGSFINYSNGIFLLSWENFSGENFLSDTLFFLKFNFNGNVSELNFIQGNEFADTSGTVINVLFENGKVTQLTGIEESKSEGKMSFYPNPGANFLYISAGKKKYQGSFKIYSITGEEVYHKSFTDYSEIIKLDISSLANGIYILSFIPTGKNITHKGFSGKFLVAK